MAKLELDGNRKERLKQMKSGPGVFVYDGSAFDTEWIPTILVTKGKEYLIKDDGMPVIDSQGRAVMKPVGTPVLDDSGRPQLGGPPKVVRHKVEVYKVWGKEFPSGEPIRVSSPMLARKLRGLSCFDELDGDEAEKPKRGRPPKKAEQEQTA